MTTLQGYGLHLSLCPDISNSATYDITLAEERDDLVGRISLYGDELSYRIEPKKCGHAYAAKAVVLVTVHAFAEMGMTEVLAGLLPSNNIYSKGTLLKAGFEPFTPSPSSPCQMSGAPYFRAQRGIWQPPVFR